ncbi:unnamed protein product, partial [Allacma fusca]
MQKIPDNSEICSGVKFIKTIFNFGTFVVAAPYWMKSDKNGNIVISSNLCMKIVETVEKYEIAFKKFSDAVGLLVFFAIFGFMPCYAVKLSLLYGGDILWIMDLVITVTVMIIVLFPAAHVHSMMKSFVPLIQSCYQDEDVSWMRTGLNMRANLIVQNIHANTMGLSGKAFVISYSFVGS